MSKMTSQEVLDYLRETIKDSESILEITSLRESDSEDDIRARLSSDLSNLYVDSGFNKLLSDEPESELVNISKFKYELRPFNETAKRLIQLLRLREPMVGR